jgi:uncharacterized protein YjeT (DUF2065 family)
VNIEILHEIKTFPQQPLTIQGLTMRWFLYVISLFYISFGCCSILYTNETKNIVKSIFSNIDQKILSALPFVFGILFIFSASATRIPWLFRLIGIMAVMEGMVFFFISKHVYDKFMDWYLNSLSDQTYRLSGILGIIFGTAALSWIL